jgi:hypothetical protein
MTLPRLPDRDAGQVDALVADRYLEGLLAATERRAGDAPSDATLDPQLRRAALVLRSALVRVHPSFRFEERLAGRLADLAAAQAAPAMAAGGGTVIPFPGPVAPVAASADDPLLRAVLAGDLDPSDADAVAQASGDAASRTPLIVVGGAAITSAAISLVGVAWVAWRAGRGDTRTAEALMRRAARSAHARRAARAALAGTGLGGPA